jgi:hypothetical protein
MAIFPAVGTDEHTHKQGQPDTTVPSLLLILTTTGRKSGEKFVFPLFYGKAGDSYIVVAATISETDQRSDGDLALGFQDHGAVGRRGRRLVVLE